MSTTSTRHMALIAAGMVAFVCLFLGILAFTDAGVADADEVGQAAGEDAGSGYGVLTIEAPQDSRPSAAESGGQPGGVAQKTKRLKPRVG